MSKSVQLKVVCSSIDGQGKAKLNPDLFQELQLRPGDRVTVARGQQSIVVEARPDPVYAAGIIRLQAPDVAALCASDGDIVEVFDGEVVVRQKSEAAPKKKKKR